VEFVTKLYKKEFIVHLVSSEVGVFSQSFIFSLVSIIPPILHTGCTL